THTHASTDTPHCRQIPDACNTSSPDSLDHTHTRISMPYVRTYHTPPPACSSRAPAYISRAPSSRAPPPAYATLAPPPPAYAPPPPNPRAHPPYYSHTRPSEPTAAEQEARSRAFLALRYEHDVLDSPFLRARAFRESGLASSDGSWSSEGSSDGSWSSGGSWEESWGPQGERYYPERPEESWGPQGGRYYPERPEHRGPNSYAPQGSRYHSQYEERRPPQYEQHRPPPSRQRLADPGRDDTEYIVQGVRERARMRFRAQAWRWVVHPRMGMGREGGWY
ncbi:hypothetical protein EDC01DRAFT_756090, partial [Geopyxis carbonaria]